MDNPIVISTSGVYDYVLDKPETSLHLISRIKASAQDKIEITVNVTHAAPRTSSIVSLKVTGDQQSFIKLVGNIVVTKQAVHTDSYLEERVLLLSSQSKAEVIPNLTILHHEVKCAHAATISDLDEEQIFYLSSRGIDLQSTKTLIAEGFLKD